MIVAYRVRHRRSRQVQVTCEAGRLQVHAGRADFAARLPARGDIEEALIAALDHGSAGVRLAAAEALAAVGTAQAVEPLLLLARRPSDDVHEQRWTALRAVADIQSRLPGAAPGQLSLAAATGGEVSLAAARGDVTLGDPRDHRRPRP